MNSSTMEHESKIRPKFFRPDVIMALKKTTPARIGVSRAGERPRTVDALNFRLDHASARDSVWNHVALERMLKYAPLHITSSVSGKEEYLLRPDRGRKAQDEDVERLAQSGLHQQRVLLLIGDGLSADAIAANLDDILPSIEISLQRYGLKASPAIFIEYARVGIMDHIGEILQPETVILLIGERPGLATSESMSAYLCYRPRIGTVESDRDVISNIHREGYSALEAGAVIADMIHRYLTYQSSGVKLKAVTSDK